MKKLFFLITLSAIFSVYNIHFIQAEKEANTNNKDAQENKQQQDYYYACTQNYGVGGTFYQEYSSLEKCQKGCTYGSCVRVDQPADTLSEYHDQAVTAN